jgi:UDP-N-acetylmuramoyl-L-alanyl-D-glutamate--2,6-diaminopimelate ligase
VKLAHLIRAALGHQATRSHPPLPDVEVRCIVQDTRELPPGGGPAEPFVFVARRGATVDGHRFAARAVAQGAVAVVGEATPEEQAGFAWRHAVPYLQVPDDRAALAQLAATLYGHPSRALFTVGVTGTDGKTTTATLLHHLLQGERPTGLLSTAGVRMGDVEGELFGHFTTPEAPVVQRTLAAFVAHGLRAAVIESSSHGLAQRRLDAIDYDLGVLTNLSPEHLDFHGTLENYRAAKAQLMARAKVSVLNADDPHYAYFAARARRVVTYGVVRAATWRATELRELPGVLEWRLTHADRSYPARLPMVGSYNVYNALAALAAAAEAGVSVEGALERLATFPGVPGRMQVVQTEPFALVVDFAHTPPALEKALAALRPQVRGRLIVVVGAAGERDPGKRAPLGAAAVRGADLAIFTEEDARSEDPEAILAQLRAGAQGAGGRLGETFWLEPDRREAIRRAVALAAAGDLVLLAGKGHERTLERREQTLPWDEVAEARRALQERG